MEHREPLRVGMPSPATATCELRRAPVAALRTGHFAQPRLRSLSNLTQIAVGPPLIAAVLRGMAIRGEWERFVDHLPERPSGDSNTHCRATAMSSFSPRILRRSARPVPKIRTVHSLARRTSANPARREATSTEVPDRIKSANRKTVPTRTSLSGSANPAPRMARSRVLRESPHREARSRTERSGIVALTEL